MSIEKLNEEPYAKIICYPKPNKKELEKRLKELKKLKVKSLEFKGEKEIFNIPVLGKGCVGIVLIANLNNEKAALKIRRVDADRTHMRHEAEMLRKANSVKVGPKLIAATKNFLLMQYIEGFLLPKWIEKQHEKTKIKTVLREILEQCWLLDKIGLDHGELSHAPKHIIINKEDKPFIIDFETASVTRKTSNVTSACQFLFISGSTAEKITEKLGKRDKKVIIEALRNYKLEKNLENFKNVIQACNLQ